jgi:endonuclease/exonuclease/phosphatase family metal-dependent hydrolase
MPCPGDAVDNMLTDVGEVNERCAIMALYKIDGKYIADVTVHLGVRVPYQKICISMLAYRMQRMRTAYDAELILSGDFNTITEDTLQPLREFMHQYNTVDTYCNYPFDLGILTKEQRWESKQLLSAQRDPVKHRQLSAELAIKYNNGIIYSSLDHVFTTMPGLVTYNAMRRMSIDEYMTLAKNNTPHNISDHSWTSLKFATCKYDNCIV